MVFFVARTEPLQRTPDRHEAARLAAQFAKLLQGPVRLLVDPLLELFQRLALEDRLSSAAMNLRFQGPSLASLPQELVHPVLADLESLCDLTFCSFLGITNSQDPRSQIHGIRFHE